MGLFDLFKNKKTVESLNTYQDETITKLKEKTETLELLIKNQNEEIPITPLTGISAESKEQNDLTDPTGLRIKRVPVKDLFQLATQNQLVFRGLSVRADEVISNGYSITGEDKIGIEKCSTLIKKSGDKAFIKQWCLNTDISGDGYVEKIPNQADTEILLLKLVSPINFGYKTDEIGDKILLNEDGTPVAYMQLVTNEDGQEEEKEVPIERISHLMFNRIGDEFNGVSTLQPLYNTAIRLMNMEHSAAEASVKSANPAWVVYTTTKSPLDLAKWAKAMGNVSSQEVVFVPDGFKVELKSPGNQNFNDYADYFLNAVVAALGVPKAILLGGTDSGSGNRSTVNTQSKHFYDVIKSLQYSIAAEINKIFEEYAEKAGFTAPVFAFNDIAEDDDRNAQRAQLLYSSGIITLEESRKMVGFDTNSSIATELSSAKIDTSTKKITDPQTQEDIKVWNNDQIKPQAGVKKEKKVSDSSDYTGMNG